jgi:hypothetical protein
VVKTTIEVDKPKDDDDDNFSAFIIVLGSKCSAGGPQVGESPPTADGTQTDSE